MTDAGGTVTSVAYYHDTTATAYSVDPGVDQCLGADARTGQTAGPSTFRPRDSLRDCNISLPRPRTTKSRKGNVAMTTEFVEMPATAGQLPVRLQRVGHGSNTRTGAQDYLGNSRQHAAGSGESTAGWRSRACPSCEYAVYATWSTASGQATTLPFTVYDGSTAMGDGRAAGSRASSAIHCDGEWTGVAGGGHLRD